MKTAIIYGAGQTGRRCFQDFKDQYDILYFVDNDSQKVGTEVLGKSVFPVSQINADVDGIILGTVYDNEKIEQQLSGMGINPSQIVRRVPKTDFLTPFLEDYAKMIENEDGQCAEVGVYRGDTASKINAIFPNRKLYLFDTFCGFDEVDLNIEKEGGYSFAQAGAFSDTSVNLVMERMKYPENILIYKGFFPDSAQDVKDVFVLVRLDLDLYAPTLSGLRMLAPLMSENGIMIIHDYFTETYKGIEKAVNQFCSEYSKKLSRIPLGDGFSILLTGF